jgi:hypothetical protein
VRHAKWMLAAALSVTGAQAGELEFQGHAVELQDHAQAPQVLRVRGTRYAIPGSREQIVAKAQLCLARKDSRSGIVSVDPAGGTLAAVSRVGYGEGAAARMVRGRLLLEADDGGFSVTLGSIGIASGPGGDDVDQAFLPLAVHADSGWKPALGAVIGVEQALIDCLFS